MRIHTSQRASSSSGAACEVQPTHTAEWRPQTADWRRLKQPNGPHTLRLNRQSIEHLHLFCRSPQRLAATIKPPSWLSQCRTHRGAMCCPRRAMAISSSHTSTVANQPTVSGCVAATSGTLCDERGGGGLNETALFQRSQPRSCGSFTSAESPTK